MSSSNGDNGPIAKRKKKGGGGEEKTGKTKPPSTTKARTIQPKISQTIPVS